MGWYINIYIYKIKRERGGENWSIAGEILKFTLLWDAFCAMTPISWDIIPISAIYLRVTWNWKHLKKCKFQVGCDVKLHNNNGNEL